MSELTAEQKELASQLTNLQRKFVIELVKPNTSRRQAYLSAGGKAKTPEAQDASAKQIFDNLKVKAFYDSLMNRKTSDAILSRDEALSILTNMARGNLAEVADFKTVQVGFDEEGNPVHQSVWALRDCDKLTPQQTALLTEITASKEGFKFKIHDSKAAIKMITEMEGWAAPSKTMDVTPGIARTHSPDEYEEAEKYLDDHFG